MVDLNTVAGMVVTIAADLMGTEDMVVADSRNGRSQYRRADNTS